MQISQLPLVKIGKFHCQSHRAFPKFFKTHPTLICRSIVQASRSLQKNQQCYLTDSVDPINKNKNLVQIIPLFFSYLLSTYVQGRKNKFAGFVWRPLEALKNDLQIKVGWVLKKSGNSLLDRHWGGGPCDFSVSPSPFGLDFGTLDFGTSDSGLTIINI